MSSALRSFVKYGSTNCVVSAFLTNGAIYGSGIPFPCQLIDLDGYYRGAGGEWLQIHDANALPANGAIPLKSIPLLAATSPGPFPSLFQSLGPITLLNGLVLAISTTEATLTISASLADFQGEVGEYEIPQAGLSIAGDLTTNVTIRTVWTAASAPPNANQVAKSLFRVDVKNTTGDTNTYYLMLLSKSAVSSVGQQPLLSWAVPDGSALILTFGESGYSPVSQTQAAPPVVTRGCILVLSTTGDVYTAAGAQTFTIRAQYK